MTRLGTILATKGMLRSAELLADYAWSGRAGATRKSQRRNRVIFCSLEKRKVLPVKKANLIVFLVWLMSERENGRRNVGSASLQQYSELFDKWRWLLMGRRKVSLLKSRCGVLAAVMQAVWGLGTATDSIGVMHDCAMLVFAFCLNGLRDSSVTSVLANNVHLTSASILVGLSLVKRKSASRVRCVRYSRISRFTSSPIAVRQLFSLALGNHMA